MHALPIVTNRTKGASSSAKAKAGAGDGAQDCSRCRNVRTCWSAGSAKHVALNLLVCRLQRNIDRDRTARGILHLLQPKLRKTARWVSRATQTPVSHTVMDSGAVAIELLLGSYVVGEMAPPLVWLFHTRYGGVQHWARRMVAGAKREHARYVSYDVTSGEQVPGSEELDLEARVNGINRAVTNGLIRSSGALLPDAGVEDDSRVQQALEVVEDGRTLPLNEYRVLRFCLNHAHGTGARMTDRLHLYLARTMGISRKDVSRLYGMAYRRVLDAMGLRISYLRARGIEPPKVRRVNRTKPLSADEVIAALDLLATSRGTILDIAWALGVTDMTVHTLRRRFQDMPHHLIREALQA